MCRQIFFAPSPYRAPYKGAPLALPDSYLFPMIAKMSQVSPTCIHLGSGRKFPGTIKASIFTVLYGMLGRTLYPDKYAERILQCDRNSIGVEYYLHTLVEGMLSNEYWL